MHRRWNADLPFVTARSLAVGFAISASLLAGCGPTDSGDAQTDSSKVQKVADQAPKQAVQANPKVPAKAQTPAPKTTQAAQQTTSTPQRIMPKRFDVATVESQTIDAGRVNPNDLAHGVFKITNNTGSPLEIDRVHITCNCTRALPRQMTIPPKSEVLVDMYIDLRGDVGPFEKQAHVYFKGFPNNPADLRLVGDFQFAIAAEPSRLRVDSQRKTGDIELVSLDGQPFKVLSINGQAPIITASTPPDGDRYTKCTLAYDLRDQAQVPAAMLIITDHPEAPVVPLRVLGFSTAQAERPYVQQLQEIALSRRFLNLGVIEAGKPMRYDMTVFRNVENHGVPLEAYFGQGDLTVKVLEITEEANASMFPKAQRVEFEVTSNITAPGQVFMTPLYMRFTPAAGGAPITQRVWAAGISAGEHTPMKNPLVPMAGN